MRRGGGWGIKNRGKKRSEERGEQGPGREGRR